MLNIKLSLMSFTLLALAGCQSMPKVAQETPNQAFSAETESGEAQERLNQINFKQLKKEQNRPIIALVLGSGGARGYAHIGAIQVRNSSLRAVGDSSRLYRGNQCRQYRRITVCKW